MQKKQQILFLEYILWGGGQEKVTYYLAHYLNRKLFEPHIAYLIQREVPVTFDPSIPIYFLEPGEPDIPILQHTAKQNENKVNIRKFFVRFIPSKLKAFVRKIVIGPPPLSPKVSFHMGLAEAEAGYNPYLTKLLDVLSKMDDDVIIISFQEGPTVLAWLNQIHNRHRYISFLCAPESIHFKLLFQAHERYLTEKWMFSNACKSANYVTVPNQWIRDDMINEFDLEAKKIKTIPNPIDRNMILQKAEAPVKLEVNIDGKTVFVQLARMDPQKNHDLTVEACDILRRKYENFILLIIGDGSEKDRIQSLIKERQLENHILLLGAMENPYPYLKLARASILTSNFEASPLALIDSMSLGTPPVSTDCIAGPAEQLDFGNCGLLVPPEDPTAFAEAMYRITIDDVLWHKFKTAGIEHTKKFDIQRFVDVWTNMLLELSNTH